MYFSELYNIPTADQRDWFDPLLELDTQLFVDPFLIFQEPEDSSWCGAHGELIAYFQRGFELLAGHHERPTSLQYRKTLRLMTFPEPREFCLGFVARGTCGSGTGSGFASLIVTAMTEAIRRGLDNFAHFEELGLLVERIGRDRISDITCNILLRHFIRYTQDVCTKHSVPTEPLLLERGQYNELRMTWMPAHHHLPVNLYTRRPVLLTPRRFLRELPALNAYDWWDYVEPELREDLNLHINERLSKRRIIALARRNPDLIRQWSSARENRRVQPYPVDRDPEGLHLWQAKGRDASRRHPLKFTGTVESLEQLNEFIGQVVKSFKWQIEEAGLWQLLFNDDTGRPKRETSIQLLFKGLVEAYCDAHGVRLDREIQLGRGPVDFCFTGRQLHRILLEVKKMMNSDYWNGLEAQLVSYLRSARCDTGWFLAVRLGDTRVQRERTQSLAERTRAAVDASGFSLSSDWIDARPKESASELAPGSEGVRGSPDDDEFGDE